MPQMAPMMWLIYFVIFILFLLLYNTMIMFLPHLNSSSNIKLPSNNNYFMLKW
uniref:ATP synthase F0 subunit 8 n=1 Tax=Tachaea chinensis TaxID=1862870 RepID=A0A7L4XTI9_9CRUS|nr:ATP synthase F0 subunit 8 [Tachaea chinensis]